MKKISLMLTLLLLCAFSLLACKPDNTEQPISEVQPKIEINIDNNTTLCGELGNAVSVEYIVDGERYGEIENYVFGENKYCIKEINLTQRNSNPYTIGECLDGWYLDSALLSGNTTRITVENNVTIQLYAQILSDTFDPSSYCMSYKLAEEYGFEGYAISFNLASFLELYPSGFFASSYKIPSTINGKKITVIEGFQEHYKTEHSLNNISFGNLAIDSGIELIAENALKWSYNSISFLDTKPTIMSGNQNNADIDP